MRLLFDTNVILDVLLEREPFVNDARTLWTANDSGTVDGYLTASALTDIHYIARKIAGSDMARQAIQLCLDAFELCPVDRETIEYAMILQGADFEDNVQIASATLAGLEGIVTRDPHGFEASLVPIFTTEDIIESLQLKS